MTIHFAVAELTNPLAEPFAVIRIDTSRRVGTGVEGRVESLHWSIADAQRAATAMNDAQRGLPNTPRPATADAEMS